MRSLLKRISDALSPRAEIILAAAGVLSLLLYSRLSPSKLILFIDKPLVNLHTIVEGDKQTAFSIMAVFAGLMLIYGIGYWATLHTRSRESWLLVIGWAAGFGMLLLFIYPFAAADIWDYIMHARIFGVHGGNPFVDLISKYPDDPFYEYAFWKTFPSTYGPAWVMVSGLVARFTGNGISANVIAFKLIPSVFLFGSLGVIALILRRMAPERMLPAVFLLAWNPMILFETFGNGHNDMSMVFWILLAVLFLVQRRYTLMILSLLMGALFKFIPLMLLPAAGLIALREAGGWKARLRFLLLTGLASIALVVVFYAPFWEGFETLTVFKRPMMFRSSLASLVYTKLGETMDRDVIRQPIVYTANLFILLYSLWEGWRAWKDRSWLSFPKSAVRTLLFYLLVACSWMMVWYPIWPLAVAVLLPPGPLLGLSILFSLTVLSKQFLIFPLFWWGKKLSSFHTELTLVIGLLGPSLAFALVILARNLFSKVKKKK